MEEKVIVWKSDCGDSLPFRVGDLEALCAQVIAERIDRQIVEDIEKFLGL